MLPLCKVSFSATILDWTPIFYSYNWHYTAHSRVNKKSIPDWHLFITQMEKKWTKWYAMTSHVIAYRLTELLFGTHTFNFNCFFDDFNCVFTQIRCLSRLLIIISILYQFFFAFPNSTSQLKSVIDWMQYKVDLFSLRLLFVIGRFSVCVWGGGGGGQWVQITTPPPRKLQVAIGFLKNSGMGEGPYKPL